MFGKLRARCEYRGCVRHVKNYMEDRPYSTIAQIDRETINQGTTERKLVTWILDTEGQAGSWMETV